jgi:chorismate dehydratase
MKVRLGAVGYLNARPLVWGLDRSDSFDLRFDVPSRCAELLHAGDIDVGLIPSIELFRGPVPYHIVPDLAIASCGPVASVCLYTTRPIADVRSIAMDTSSRSSVALVRVLCARQFGIEPALQAHGPDLTSMLATCDAALVIGDNALFMDVPAVASALGARVEVVDLGEVWTRATGLPFVYAFWAGRPGALAHDAVRHLHTARAEGVRRLDAVAAGYFRETPERAAAGARYLRDNIKYGLDHAALAGLDLFFRHAAEAGLVERAGPVRFFPVS